MMSSCCSLEISFRVLGDFSFSQASKALPHLSCLDGLQSRQHGTQLILFCLPLCVDGLNSSPEGPIFGDKQYIHFPLSNGDV